MLSQHFFFLVSTFFFLLTQPQVSGEEKSKEAARAFASDHAHWGNFRKAVTALLVERNVLIIKRNELVKKHDS